MNYLFNALANNKNKASISAKLREKRFSLFMTVLSVQPEDRILDVGGAEDTWLQSGLENKVTLLNLRFEKQHPAFSYIYADACDMNMINDGEYDIAFSNSVIEHVGIDKQPLFAKEIQRVGKSSWVQTPNKLFPIEPHFVFPFFQYLPAAARKFVALQWPYSHYRFLKMGEKDVLEELGRLHLLREKEFRGLFNESKIIHENYFGMVKSLIAYHKG